MIERGGAAMTTRYDSYLLRVWRKGEAGWSGRLEHLPDGHSLRFSSPAALLEHLRGIMGDDADGGQRTPHMSQTPRTEDAKEGRQEEARDRN